MIVYVRHYQINKRNNCCFEKRKSRHLWENRPFGHCRMWQRSCDWWNWSGVSDQMIERCNNFVRLDIFEIEFIPRDERPGVNFNNVLKAAFTHADPKNAKKTVKLSSFIALLGSVGVKAARRTLVKLTPECIDYRDVKCSGQIQGLVASLLEELAKFCDLQRSILPTF